MIKSNSQIEKETSRIMKLDKILESFTTHFASLYSGNIKREHIFKALFLLLEDKYQLDWLGDLSSIDLEYDEVEDLLTDFDFNIIFNTVETAEGIIPDNFLFKYKARFKNNGLIWVIHKNDLDPFPSNPHAHQLENNLKLDLSNGNCYKKKELITTIKKKELLSIRDNAIKVFKGKLPLLRI